MTPHKGKRLFITGIPTSGKSYLAKQLAEKVGGIAVILDNFRENLSQEEKYKQWVNFYLDKDEETYYLNTSPEDQWKNFAAQSEGLWPAFIHKIDEYKDESKPVIFECVNMLPHLVKKDLDFPGIVLIGSTFEETLARNKKDPRWGDSEYLQTLEAKSFFFTERPKYIEEAKKYGYQVFKTADEAVEVGVSMLM